MIRDIFRDKIATLYLIVMFSIYLILSFITIIVHIHIGGGNFESAFNVFWDSTKWFLIVLIPLMYMSYLELK